MKTGWEVDREGLRAGLATAGCYCKARAEWPNELFLKSIANGVLAHSQCCAECPEYCLGLEALSSQRGTPQPPEDQEPALCVYGLAWMCPMNGISQDGVGWSLSMTLGS